MKTSSLTPMMSQFLKIKSQYSDSLLFYRMGDFYELFFEDAEIASAALNITLTKRGKHNGQDIPMCGVPYHSSENYLLNLIRKGHKVAVCEQLEKPEEAKKRGYKAVVKRDVVRLITPGTITEEGLLNENLNNFILCVIKNKDYYGVAWTDISTGEFYCSDLREEDFLSLITRISPSEILVATDFEESFESLNPHKNIIVSSLPSQNFDSTLAKKRLEKFFNIKSVFIHGDFSTNEIKSMGALLSYLEVTQCGQMIPLMPPIRETDDLYLKIDTASRKSLEITRALDGEIKGSLLWAINQTLTSGGSRLLQDSLNCPSTNVNEIINRQEIINFFIKNQLVMNKCRDILKHTPDMQRSIARLGLNRGGPRDLSIIRNSLRSIQKISSLVCRKNMPQFLCSLVEKFKGFESILNSLNSALIESPPTLTKSGHFICSKYNKNLEDLRLLKENSQNLLIQLQLKYIKLTNVNSLKVKFNNVLGYFIETPISHSDKMTSNLLSELFIHRQTTTNSARFSTLELSSMASNLINAEEKASELENQFFIELTKSVIDKSYKLNLAASSLSQLDLYSSLSFQSISAEWTRPKIDNSKTFEITGGRHPVVELSLKRSGSDNFVSNDCDLSAKAASILLITGPNMAGKSTFLRQNALITILAQIGSYVPAKIAHIGIIDQIFSRVGASDDLSKGNSTFMVEMIESAGILKGSTESSLIIMDEIGRGTSTYDGLSIAWATLEYIHNIIKCRTLFATHYHELTQLENNFPNIRNAKVAIREWKDEVIFLHEVKYGTADKSYGIQVAKLAGLPTAVTNRARVILEKLENTENKFSKVSSQGKDTSNNISIQINNLENKSNEKKLNEALKVFNMLKSLNTDDITPREALNIIAEAVSNIKSVL